MSKLTRPASKLTRPAPERNNALHIKSFFIEGLFGRSDVSGLSLDKDLAILTGRNGAGKTSVLKLLWAITSGNILVGLNEVPFSRATVETDIYKCTVHRLGPKKCKVDFSMDGDTVTYEDNLGDGESGFMFDAEEQANERLIEIGQSVFFPTFRRIEGGFTIAPGRPAGVLSRQGRARSDIDEALAMLSRSLTHNSHLFVSALSTNDIVTLLLREFADLSDKANVLQAEVSRDIIARIKAVKLQGDDTEQLGITSAVLKEISARVESLEGSRSSIMAPMTEARKLVESLFEHAGINFGPRMSFGDAANAMNSDSLSAGEKQMLSFVCYNAFYRNSIIFIDEPELSLHVDWQRQLFGILERQKSSNQFIIATHSPFIYGKYPDKEVELSSDRGQNLE